MLTVDALQEKDCVLATQFRLALASPLWRWLPYGTQPNPRTWQIELEEVRPGRRLSARLWIPWRPSAPGREPLELKLRLWHGEHAHALHQRLIQFDALMQPLHGGDDEACGPVFYDALSHALVYPHQPGLWLIRQLRAYLHESWMRRLVQTVMGLHIQMPRLARRRP